MGSPRRPTQFGYKATVADTADGFVITDVPQRGGPVDGSLLDGAISKAKRAGMQVRSVYADRGFGTSTADAALAQHRIRDPVIPRQQRRRRSSRPVRLASSLSLPKRARGADLTTEAKGPAPHRLRSLEGAQTWVGGIALAHNLQRMALLT